MQSTSFLSKLNKRVRGLPKINAIIILSQINQTSRFSLREAVRRFAPNLLDQLAAIVLVVRAMCCGIEEKVPKGIHLSFSLKKKIHFCNNCESSA